MPLINHRCASLNTTIWILPHVRAIVWSNVAGGAMVAAQSRHEEIGKYFNF